MYIFSILNSKSIFSEEQLSIIADKTISEADIDEDGLISFDEFSKTFEKSDIEHKMSIRFLN